MSELSRLGQAITRLQEAYGHPAAVPESSTWTRFLKILLGFDGKQAAGEAQESLLKSAPLATAAETAAADTGTMVEVLKPIPRGPQKASVVRALATWWIEQFGDDDSPEWTKGTGTYRELLRQIRGLGPATVDELLLQGAGLPVFPVDRSALRVAVRHGWLDIPVEDEQAQSFFVSGLGRNVTELQKLSRLLSRVGEAHCGRVPQCDGCPLQPLLPAGGPLNPESC